MENNHSKRPFTLWDKITWAIIIIFIIWGVYSMGKNSNKKLTPEEMRQESANCYKWTGEDCQPYSAD